VVGWQIGVGERENVTAIKLKLCECVPGWCSPWSSACFSGRLVCVFADKQGVVAGALLG